MNSHLLGRTVRLAAVPLAASAFVLAASAARADDGNAKSSDLDHAVQSTILRGDPVSNLYDDVQKWKKDEGVPIEIGAWHWWHMFRNKQNGSRHLQYGTRGLEGTYFYYLRFDPETDNGAGTKMGAHVDARIRDGDQPFRPFYDSRAWLWECYGWLEACDTKFKLGKINHEFGLSGDGDGSFYGSVPYFDGWKLDPDWGASVERTCDFGHGVTAPSFIQAFTGRVEDEVNGSISGADVESDERARENFNLGVRTVPTWKFANKSSLALGLSAQVGQIDSRDVGTHQYTAQAVDLTFTQGPFKAYAEWMQSIGSRNPANYVTGGASDRSVDMLVGAAYTHGFATIRGTVSKGTYAGPGGKQLIYLLGVTLAVTKNVDFYVEWVRWDAGARNAPGRVFVDDGINFVLNWRF